MDTESVIAQDAGQEVEKTLSQAEVNALIGKEKAAAAARARREADEAYQAEIAQLKSQTKPVGGMAQPNVDEIYNQVYEKILAKAQQSQQEAEEARRAEEMNQLANEFYGKMESVKDKYPDYASVMADFKPEAFPEIVILTSGMENAGDVMYDLAKNPHKVASVLQLAQRDAGLARKALNAISGSIAQNQEAISQNRNAPEPLSRPKPSTAGVDSGGPNSVAAFKQADWLRG